MAHKVHHLDCATLCVGAAKMFKKGGSWREPFYWSCHCLLIESDDGLILVDVGFATSMVNEASVKGSLLRKGMRVAEAQCALQQVRALGFSASDVRHIVLTHLDVDHAGGIEDFPNATVHVHYDELATARRPKRLWDRLRYQYSERQRVNWHAHGYFGESWYGFDGVQAVSSERLDLLMVPLIGHSAGHCGVAVRTSDGWLLHCGDAYFEHGEIASAVYKPPLATRTIQQLDDYDRSQRLRNLQRLRALNAQQDDIELICSHDQGEFHCCSARH